MASSLSSGGARLQRLPVNPRRHKVPPEARKRVQRACNGCNVRRAKCSGGNPCERCVKSSRECVYPVSEPTITLSRAAYDELLRRCHNAEAGRENGPSNDNLHQEQAADFHEALSEPGSDGSTDGSAFHREGRILQDPDGVMRYMGESSGATFLNHLREHLATMLPPAFDDSAAPDATFIAYVGQYQTDDSRPLMTNAVDPMILPSKLEALKMFSEFRYWMQDGAATVESGGLYYWLAIDELTRQYEAYIDDPAECPIGGTMAIIDAAFAVSCQFNPSCAPDWANSQTFFMRARDLVGNPLDASNINDATVLALMGYYHLNSNRRDVAYLYINVAMHILVVHGIHRAWMIDEDGKRLFWTIYSLDRWLSKLMGRPVMISDDSIKLDLPRDAKGLPPPKGLCAHIHLSRISHYITSHVYEECHSAARPSSMVTCIQTALAMLREWRQSLPDLLQLTEDNFSQDRAVYDLRMHHNQLVILAVRPLLFNAVKTLTTELCNDHRNARMELWYRLELREAAVAARQNICLSKQLLELRGATILSHSNIHYLFNGALNLILHHVISEDNSADDQKHITLTANLLRQDSNSNRAFAHDCAKVLSDLASMLRRLEPANSESRNRTKPATGGATSMRTVDLRYAVKQAENAARTPSQNSDAHLATSASSPMQAAEWLY